MGDVVESSSSVCTYTTYLQRDNRFEASTSPWTLTEDAWRSWNRREGRHLLRTQGLVNEMSNETNESL